MPTSLYMPDVKVEIAFNAGFHTPDADRVWTDVSQWVDADEKIEINYGRSDQFSTAEPNKVTLTLDNSDGRFTAKRSASPYFPNVKIGRPIRVTTTPVAGAASKRIVAFVDEWPIEWPGITRHAKAKISATSRMNRLSAGYVLPSLATAVNVSQGAIYAFPLDASAEAGEDVLGSTAQLVPTGAVDFGEDGAKFDGTSLARTALPTPLIAPANYAVFCVVKLEQLPTGSDRAHLFELLGGDRRLVIYVDSSGIIWEREYDQEGNLLWSVDTISPVVVAGRTFTFCLVIRPDTFFTHLINTRLYVDGDYETQVLNSPVSRITALRVGRGMNGAIRDLAIFNQSLDDPTIDLLHRSATDGFAGESTQARLERMAQYFAALLPADTYSFTGTGPVEAIPTAGRNLLEAMRDVESAEGGVLHDGRDGRLLYYPRTQRFNTSPAVTLAVTQQEVAGFTPRMDKSQLTNEAAITGASGLTFFASNATSAQEYGPARKSETLALSDHLAESLAGHLVAMGSEPGVRIPDLAVNLLDFSAARQAAILALTIGSRIAVTTMPSQAHASSEEFFVEGATESIGSASYELSFNVSPTDGGDVFELNHATRGALDNPTYLIGY